MSRRSLLASGLKSQQAPCYGFKMPIYALLMLFFVLSGCGSDSHSNSSSARKIPGISVAGGARRFIVPQTSASPAFRDFDLDFVAWDAASEPNSPSVLGTGSLQSASASCADTGCKWQATGIVFADASHGVLARVSPKNAQAGWLSTASLVVNGNQATQVARFGSSVAAFAPALVLPQAALDTWAQALGSDANTLLGRGICLGFVWQKPSAESFDKLPGRAGVTLALDASAAGASLMYPNANYANLSGSATNADGAFVVVGPANPNAQARYDIPLTIQAAASNLRYIDPRALIRPGWVTIVPLMTKS